METRNSYGYGYVGSNEKGFEWMLVYGEKAHQRMKSGYVYKTEEEAIREGKKFQEKSTYEPYKNGQISKEYTIKYREKGNRNGQIFETSCTGRTRREVLTTERSNLGNTGYVIVECKIA